MKMNQLRALFEAGLTDEQISAVLGTSRQQDPAQSPEPKQQEPESKQQEPDLQQILQAITGLTETIQASNIAGAKNKEPETIDDILGSLLEAD